MRIKINNVALGVPVDTIIEVDGVNGVPVDIFWRRRLKDAAIDKCCEVVKDDKADTPSGDNSEVGVMTDGQ